VWDNRFLLHRGVHDFKYERRHLIRTTVAGERPLGPGDFTLPPAA
jgi:alpha-ketoglutarate-dependent taurine dioxygenase